MYSPKIWFIIYPVPSESFSKKKKDSSCIPTNINKNQNSAILKLRRDWRDLKPGEELKFICDFGFRTYQNSTTEFFPQLMLNI